MSLSASMWTGVSGLLGHGEKMNVLGNNIANVSTVGFKGQRMDFEDFIYANTYSAAGPAQIGRGVSIGAVMGDFSQGAFEKTNDATDLAIGGRGFFKVVPKGTETAYYTRAGNFRFDKDGYLQDPHGYVLQGKRIDNSSGPTQASGGSFGVNTAATQIRGVGVPTDIRLDTWTVPPKATTNIAAIVNLSRTTGSDQSRNVNNPFAGLIQAWDGTQPPANNRPAIAQDAFSYSTSIKVYDEAGVQHTLTVYYDKVAPDTYERGTSNDEIWEYIVTMDPSEDQRTFFDDSTGQAVPMASTKMGGLLMSGTMHFNAGQLINQTSYTLFGSTPYTVDSNGNPVSDSNYMNIGTASEPSFVPRLSSAPTTWNQITDVMYPAAVSNSGFPMMVANFTGAQSANTTNSPNGNNFLIEYDLGLRMSNFNNPWNNNANMSSLAMPGVLNRFSSGPRLVTENPAYVAGAESPTNTATWPYLVNSSAVAAYGLPVPNATAATTIQGLVAGAMTGTPPTYLQPNTNYVAANFDVTNPVTWPFKASISGPTTAADFHNWASYVNDTRQPWTEGTLYAAAPLTNSTALATATDVTRQPNASTNFGSASTTVFSSQNGYGFGNLTSYSVDQDGILSGVYSNGVTLPLYQIELYDFVNKQGLYREGGNLYSQTRDSGEAQSGPPQDSGLGKVVSYNIEQSNVDLATEFVQMITTQRGFQSNSKVITTTDTMLETVIQMKR